MSAGIHHINFVVADLNLALPVWEALLQRPPDSLDHLAERGVDIARFQLGDTWLVLVQPVRENTVVARHLETHGEGFLLMSLGVGNLDEQVERLGEDFFSGPARHGLDDWQVRDIDPAQLCGARLQLVAQQTKE